MNHGGMALSYGANAGLYDRLRPGYPAAALDWALAGAVSTTAGGDSATAAPGVRTALDLGAGTGRLTTSLVDRFGTVVAVEPDARMRGVLAGRLPGVAVAAGVAEGIPLAAGSVDAVFIGQAFHWFARPAADREIARVLRPGGIVAVLTNVNPDGANYEDVLHRRVLRIAQPSLAHATVGLAGNLFAGERERLVANPQVLSREEFLALPATWSWVATAREDERQRVAAQAQRLASEIQESDGTITMPYATRVVRAVRRAG